MHGLVRSGKFGILVYTESALEQVFLMETSEIEDMIINCVALGFILQIAAMQHLVMFHSGNAP